MRQVGDVLRELKHAGAIEEKIQTREIRGRERTYSELALTELGWSVMKQEASDFMMVFPSNNRVQRQRPSAESVNDRAHPELLTALKVVRKQLADKDDVPLYVVAPNKTLEDIAARRPTTRGAMMTISGMGSRRWSRYGRVLMETVRTWNLQ